MNPIDFQNYTNIPPQSLDSLVNGIQETTERIKLIDVSIDQNGERETVRFNEPKISKKIPTKIRKHLLAFELPKFFGSEHHMFQVPCRRFSPTLFALIVRESTAHEIIMNREYQDAVSSWVRETSGAIGKSFPHQREFALVIYVPFRSLEELEEMDRVEKIKQRDERPIAVFAKNLPRERRQVLVEALMVITGVEFTVVHRNSDVWTFLIHPGKGEPLYGHTLDPIDYGPLLARDESAHR